MLLDLSLLWTFGQTVVGGLSELTGAISGDSNQVGTAHARTAALDAQVVGAGVVDQRALVTLSEQLQLYDVII